MTAATEPPAMQGFSRRSTLMILALLPVPGLLSCRKQQPASDLDDADQQLQRFADSYNSLVRREPDLPGIRSLAQVKDQLLAGLSDEDVRLLTSAVHLESRERAASIKKPIGEADVRAALSRPIDLSRYGRPALERTLASAKTRAAADPAYRSRLSRLPPGTIKCVDENGVSYSPALCEFLLWVGYLQLARV